MTKATNASEKQVDAYLRRKSVYTKLFVVHRNSYPQLLALASEINDIPCIEVACMDKSALPNDCENCLFVCVDVLSSFLGVDLTKSLTSVASRNSLLSMLKKTVNTESVRITLLTESGLIKLANLKVNIAISAKMSSFTKITHLAKPGPLLPNAALDRSRQKLFAAWKKSVCGATLTNSRTLCQQSTNN